MRHVGHSVLSFDLSFQDHDFQEDAMWWITCPNPTCGFQAKLMDFEPSCADECTCPKCEEFFQWEEPEDEEEEEDADCPSSAV